MKQPSRRLVLVTPNKLYLGYFTKSPAENPASKIKKIFETLETLYQTQLYLKTQALSLCLTHLCQKHTLYQTQYLRLAHQPASDTRVSVPCTEAVSDTAKLCRYSDTVKACTKTQPQSLYQI